MPSPPMPVATAAPPGARAAALPRVLGPLRVRAAALPRVLGLLRVRAAALPRVLGPLRVRAAALPRVLGPPRARAAPPPHRLPASLHLGTAPLGPGTAPPLAPRAASSPRP